MPQAPAFAFDDILALEFVREGKSLDEEYTPNPFYAYDVKGLDRGARLKCIKEMIEEALDDFRDKESEWFVTVMCFDRISVFGGAINYPISIALLKLVYELHKYD